MITCTFDKDNGSILMEFSTHHVELKGLKLELLFEKLMIQENKVLRVMEDRYKPLDLSDKFTITNINVSSKVTS